MDGYGLSLDELRTTCQKVAAEADDLSRQADEVRRSEVISADFGATATEIGASYVAVTHGVLADSLEVFRAASENVISKLLATFDEYQRVDEDNSMRFRSGL
jgi:hypothetical protein